MEKSDRIGGAMQAVQAQRFTMSHHPGGNPLTVALPADVEASLKQPATSLKHPLNRLDVPVITAAGLTRGMPLDVADGERFRVYVSGLLGTDSEAAFKQQVMQYVRDRGYEMALRTALMDRAVSLYKNKGKGQGTGARRRQLARGATPGSTPMKADLVKAEVFTLPAELAKAHPGPFIGPNGGKWRDIKHTQHWTAEDERKHHGPNPHAGGTEESNAFEAKVNAAARRADHDAQHHRMVPKPKGAMAYKTKGGETRSTPVAHRSGLYVVHPEIGNMPTTYSSNGLPSARTRRWTVSHGPSGMPVRKNLPKEEAVDLARHMDRHAPSAGASWETGFLAPAHHPELLAQRAARTSFLDAQQAARDQDQAARAERFQQQRMADEAREAADAKRGGPITPPGVKLRPFEPYLTETGRWAEPSGRVPFMERTVPADQVAAAVAAAHAEVSEEAQKQLANAAASVGMVPSFRGQRWKQEKARKDFRAGATFAAKMLEGKTFPDTAFHELARTPQLATWHPQAVQMNLDGHQPTTPAASARAWVDLVSKRKGEPRGQASDFWTGAHAFTDALVAQESLGGHAARMKAENLAALAAILPPPAPPAPGLDVSTMTAGEFSRFAQGVLDAQGEPDPAERARMERENADEARAAVSARLAAGDPAKAAWEAPERPGDTRTPEERFSDQAEERHARGSVQTPAPTFTIPADPVTPGPARTVPKKGQLDMFKSGGPFIGPHGGKWANAQHTIPWSPSVHGGGWSNLPGGRKQGVHSAFHPDFQELADNVAQGHVDPDLLSRLHTMAKDPRQSTLVHEAATGALGNLAHLQEAGAVNRDQVKAAYLTGAPAQDAMEASARGLKAMERLHTQLTQLADAAGSTAKRKAPKKNQGDLFGGMAPPAPAKAPKVESGQFDMFKSLAEPSALYLAQLLARLQGLREVYQVLHWNAAGPTSYGDHLLFERLYDNLAEEVDDAAEKLVGATGEPVPGTMAVSPEDPSAELALSLERELCEDFIPEVKAVMLRAGDLSEGLDNYLQGLVDAHERNVYLLQQRVAPLSKGAGEGSRGGHVIGHTSVGQPIYAPGPGTVAHFHTRPRDQKTDAGAELVQRERAEHVRQHMDQMGAYSAADHAHAAALHGAAASGAAASGDHGTAAAHAAIATEHLAKQRHLEGAARANDDQPGFRRRGRKMQKADGGGEGSRGGHIIGHTAGGKPVYASLETPHHGFGIQDHLDARSLHLDAKERHLASGNLPQALHHQNMAAIHHAAAKHMHQESTFHSAASYRPPTMDSLAQKMSKPAPTRLQRVMRAMVGKSEAELDGMLDLMEKSGTGEGSRGGHIVGHTGSGKPIYATHDHTSHAGFTSHDHADAAYTHRLKAERAAKAGDADQAHAHLVQERRHNAHVANMRHGEGRAVPSSTPAETPKATLTDKARTLAHNIVSKKSPKGGDLHDVGGGTVQRMPRDPHRGAAPGGAKEAPKKATWTLTPDKRSPDRFGKAERFILDLEKAGPYIGPRGGKWADPKHTIAWVDPAGAPKSHVPAKNPKDRARKEHGLHVLGQSGETIHLHALGIHPATPQEHSYASSIREDKKFWDRAKERSVPGSSKFHGTEKEVKSKHVGPVVRGEVALREGYAPQLLERHDGSFVTVDGHHRMAMHKMLGSNSFTAKVAPMPPSLDPTHPMNNPQTRAGKQLHARAAKFEVEPRTVANIEQRIANGELKGTVAWHVEQAVKAIAIHKAALPAFNADLAALAPSDASVKARVKDLDSAVNKVARKPHYGDASTLQDLTGGRVIVKTRVKDLDSAVNKVARRPDYLHAGTFVDMTGGRIILDSVAAVRKTVANIKAKYELAKDPVTGKAYEDDYITNPLGDYRSYHLIIMHDGQPKELQIRTERQNTFAEWAHHVYKPETPEQEHALSTHKKEIEQYSRQASEFMWLADQGKPTDPPGAPPCTPAVHASFGCMELHG